MNNTTPNSLRDRRRVFIGLAIVMIFAVLAPFSSEVTISEPVQETFDYIDHRLQVAGFSDVALYGSLDGADYDLDSERLIAVAWKG